MPKLGLTMKTGKVARWLVAEGACVHQGDEIFEVETDKITNKVESPADGVVHILVPQGEVVEVGTVLGLLGEAGEAVAAPAQGASAPAAAPSGEAEEEGAGGQAGHDPGQQAAGHAESQNDPPGLSLGDPHNPCRDAQRDGGVDQCHCDTRRGHNKEHRTCAEPGQGGA